MSVRVDWRTALALVGSVVAWLAVPMAVPALLALWYGEPVLPFAAGVVACITVGGGFRLLHPDPVPDLGAREGFLAVSMAWLFVSVVGAVPFVVAGLGTASSLAHPVNALFESMSGFTTTGATVLAEISLDRHGHALLLWRQLTQWLGGMGIVVLAVAVLPELSVGGAQLMDAEAPGPGIQKLTPRIAETARVLWGLYLGFTAAEALLLYGLHVGGLAPNMGAYDAVAHALTTMPTGGFSPAARSIEAFSAAVQWAVVPFMVAAGTNFALFWHVTTGEPDHLLRDREFRTYAGVLGVAAAVLTGLLVFGAAETDAVRHAVFQVASIVTTTGYASFDFNAWPTTAKSLLLVAMFVGGSAGSTGGAVKIVRWYVVAKAVRRELFLAVHPDAVRPLRLGGRALDDRAVRGITSFTLLYLLVFAVGLLLVVVDASRVGLDLTALEAASAVAATLGNVGPGFGQFGPMNSYLALPSTSKLLLVFLMWVGRLEILPVFVLLTRAYWRS